MRPVAEACDLAHGRFFRVQRHDGHHLERANDGRLVDVIILSRYLSLGLDAALISGLVDPANEQDRAIAEDLITGAVNSALQKARELAEREMASAASEMGLPLPPGGLGGFIS